MSNHPHLHCLHGNQTKSTTSNILHAPSAQHCLAQKIHIMNKMRRFTAIFIILLSSQINVRAATVQSWNSLWRLAGTCETNTGTLNAIWSARCALNMEGSPYFGDLHSLAQFWNVKVIPHRSSGLISYGSQQEPLYIEQEQWETPALLKEKQIWMEQLIYHIWTCVMLVLEACMLGETQQWELCGCGPLCHHHCTPHLTSCHPCHFLTVLILVMAL